MNGVRVVFIALCLSLMAVSTGTAENCQTIYQTDFSSDPGWITSNPTYYHWDPSSETYYADQYNINYGGNYTYY